MKPATPSGLEREKGDTALSQKMVTLKHGMVGYVGHVKCQKF